MICQLVFGWLFCRPIKPLVVPLPIFLWLNAVVFLELIGKSYLMLVPDRCSVGTMASSTSFLFSICCKKFPYTPLSNYSPLLVTIN